MNEEMNGLEEMMKGVTTYCNDNKIEYVFAAVADGGKRSLVSHNMIANVVLKESAKIIKALTGNK